MGVELIPVVLVALAALLVIRRAAVPLGEFVEEVQFRWDVWRQQAAQEAAARRHERDRRRTYSAYQAQASREQQAFHRAFDDDSEREQRRQDGAVGEGIDEEIFGKAKQARGQKAMLHVIERRTKGCCNVILTARQTMYEDPAFHPLCRRSQARVLHYLDRFREHLYASPLLDEDATVAQTVLIVEAARRVCAQCPLRDSSVSNPAVPCETVKAFSPRSEFDDEPV